MTDRSFKARRPQIEPLTGLRGCAALLVVIYHLAGGFLPNLGIGETTMLLRKGYLAVDLFFLLSGFVMMHVHGATFAKAVERSDLADFILARAARLYPLHLAILCGFVALEAAKSVLLALDPGLPGVAAFVGGRSFPALLSHLTMTQGLGLFEGPTWNGPAWSIGAEWFAYLVFPILVLLLARQGVAFRLALLAAMGVGLFALSRRGIDLDLTAEGGLWRCLFEFAAGMMLYELHASGRLKAVGSDFFAVATLGLIAVSLHLGLRDMLVLPLLALLILSLARNAGRAAKVFSTRTALFLGTVSYAVYLSHMLLIEIANLSSRAVTGAPLGVHLGQGASMAVLLAALPAIVAVAWGLHRGVELPGRAAIKAWRPVGRGEAERA